LSRTLERELNAAERDVERANMVRKALC